MQTPTALVTEGKREEKSPRHGLAPKRDVGIKYANGRPTKDRGISPIPKKTINRQKENNAIVNNVVDEILLNETQEVSTTNHEAPEFMDCYYNTSDFLTS